MNKELIIKAFNKAIQAFAAEGGKVCKTDVVVDFDLDTLKVATLMDRHPGSLKLYVKLEEGSGIMFLSWVNIRGNVCPRLAWEEDNGLHSPYSLLAEEDYSEYQEANAAIKDIIDNFLLYYW